MLATANMRNQHGDRTMPADRPGKVSFSTASANLSTFKRVPVGGNANTIKGDQIGRITAKGATSGETNPATLVLALIDPSNRVRYKQVSFTATGGTAQDDAAGTGGLYLATVDVAGSGTDKFDLLGNAGGLEWWVGFTVAGSFSSIDLYFDFTRST